MNKFYLLTLGFTSIVLAGVGAGATGGEQKPAVAPFRLECKVQLMQTALNIEKDITEIYTFTEETYQVSTGPGAKGFAISVVPFGKLVVPQRLQVTVELNGETQNGSYSGVQSSVATAGDLNSVSTTLSLKTESEFPDVLRRRILQVSCTDKSLAARE
jgi:hypothetical protein